MHIRKVQNWDILKFSRGFLRGEEEHPGKLARRRQTEDMSPSEHGDRLLSPGPLKVGGSWGFLLWTQTPLPAAQRCITTDMGR